MTTSTLPAAAPPAPPAPGRPGPNGWLVIGGVFAVTLVVLGALSVAGWLGYRTEIQTQSYATPGLRTIVIDIDNGDVTVTPGAADTVDVTRRLHFAFERPTVDEHWDGQTLRATTGCRSRWIGPGCGVDYTLTVPEGVEVRARTSTGDISVRNILGELELSTSTGDISVTGARQALALHTRTGDIDATGLDSETVDASTNTGDVTLRFERAPSSVTAKASTGDIQVSVPGGQPYRIQADSRTGDIHIDVPRDDASRRVIEVRTGTGDIDIQRG